MKLGHLATFSASLNVPVPSIYNSDETGTLREAEKVAIFFKDYLKPGDRILAKFPSDAPLIYYFMVHDIPLRHAIDPDARVFAVVNKSLQTLEEILGSHKMKRDDFVKIKLIKEYPSAAIYELYKAAAGGP